MEKQESILKEEKDIQFEIPLKPSRKELLEMFDEMIKSYENLPPLAMSTYVTHYDLLSSMLLVSSILKAE